MQRLGEKLKSFPDIPENTYVSDILPSHFDENIVFASFDDTKRDNFKPYLLKSTDKGKSWESISNNLPLNGAVHTIEQDFMDPDLLFVGTEFGVFFSNDGGAAWHKLSKGIPTIPVEDIAIQKEKCDIILATFGRGFYILDNYSSLRAAKKELLTNEAYLFPVKDAFMYIESRGRYGAGSNFYKASNPDYGSTFTYYIKEAPKTLKEIRREKEKKLFKESKPIPPLTDEEKKEEKEEISPYLIFTIKDSTGNTVRKLTTDVKKGINRLTWDLRFASVSPIENKKFNPEEKPKSSTLVFPGKYNVSLSIVTREGEKILAGPVEFNVTPLKNTTLPAADRKELIAFQKKANEIERTVMGTEKFLDGLIEKIVSIEQSLLNTPDAPYQLLEKTKNISKELHDIKLKFERDSDFPSVEENPPSPVTFNERLDILRYTHFRSTSDITQNEKNAYTILMKEFPPVHNRIKNISEVEIKNIEAELENYHAPWSPGRLPELNVK